MKKITALYVTVVFVSLVCVGLAVRLFLPKAHPVDVTPVRPDVTPVTLTTETLYDLIEPCEKLVTASDQYVVRGEVEDAAHLFNLTIPLTTDRISFSCTGDILVGVDLSAVRFDINEASRNVYITLPSPEIEANTLDTSSFLFTAERNSIFTEIAPDEFVAAADALKADKAKEVMENGKVSRLAKRNAEAVLTGLLKTAPEARDYDLHFYYA